MFSLHISYSIDSWECIHMAEYCIFLQSVYQINIIPSVWKLCLHMHTRLVGVETVVAHKVWKDITWCKRPQKEDEKGYPTARASTLQWKVFNHYQAKSATFKRQMFLFQEKLHSNDLQSIFDWFNICSKDFSMQIINLGSEHWLRDDSLY